MLWSVFATSERSKLLGAYFKCSQSNWEICGNYFFASWRKAGTRCNLILQFTILGILKDISFSFKSNFHFKGSCRISADSINKINVCILQFKMQISKSNKLWFFTNFGEIHYSQCVITNLTEITLINEN